MATEFFTDAELASFRQMVDLLARDLEELSRRAHDHSKQRMHHKLTKVHDDLGVVIRTLPHPT